MSLPIRDIVGIVHRPDGNVWSGATVLFILKRNVGFDEFVVPAAEVSVQTDSTGAFRASLSTITDSSLPWRCVLPNQSEFSFDLVPGCLAAAARRMILFKLILSCK